MGMTDMIAKIRFIQRNSLLEKKRVLVGLSGGVDSSVAAWLLKEQGHQVTGVTMALWDGGYQPSGKHACYGSDEEEEIREAREVAQKIGIPYHVFNCATEYKQAVLSYFRMEYLAGRTPNPCVQCNQLIKFGLLPQMALKSGIKFDFFATGHYARVDYNESTQRFILKKGVDPNKDQTYFIYRLSQEQLGSVMFPVGGFFKHEIRALSRKAGITAPDLEESQDFYGGDYKDLLNAEDHPGEIVDSGGTVLGHHRGIWNYTIGQRKGLGIAYPEPLYVLRLDTASNRVIVGTRKETYQTTFLVENLNWIAINGLDREMECKARIRSAQKEHEARIEPMGDGLVRVTFFHPNDSIAPGQSAVFYHDDLVLGGGIIKETVSLKP